MLMVMFRSVRDFGHRNRHLVAVSLMECHRSYRLVAIFSIRISDRLHGCGVVRGCMLPILHHYVLVESDLVGCQDLFLSCCWICVLHRLPGALIRAHSFTCAIAPTSMVTCHAVLRVASCGDPTFACRDLLQFELILLQLCLLLTHPLLKSHILSC